MVAAGDTEQVRTRGPKGVESGAWTRLCRECKEREHSAA
jgi:hypothetical protein